ncbi:hypothetical protein E5345_03865 [Propionibacterium sp. NM47_B9-13]|uniref:Uncharacterized protein n=1 Tax=Cutibacterium modestum HL044PA1 TaxID=765109 RepID=A0ABN0C2A9_9ACTN|nr:hypothetical protein HMPREF9621_00205 [Cutibacterium modestum HL037PA2]EFS91302.1 hypothetical protein HMPREF9607_02594 [Cutibacterium modestum HL044PA1]EFT16685.1 hypothetical protein HMPREF9622_00228 [Cutibacterium modestum HL037PA3]REB75514.1 hypothetical protein CP877_02010 [Cutibacterium modestum]TGY29180.1 hypothetical protein E5345_03865 [Propionibacterium sp. NM47_B9-13]
MRGCSSYGGCSCQRSRRLPDFHGYLPYSRSVGHAARRVIRPHHHTCPGLHRGEGVEEAWTGATGLPA